MRDITEQEHGELDEYLNNFLLLANEKGISAANYFKYPNTNLIDETLTELLEIDMERDGL